MFALTIFKKGGCVVWDENGWEYLNQKIGCCFFIVVAVLGLIAGIFIVPLQIITIVLGFLCVDLICAGERRAEYKQDHPILYGMAIICIIAIIIIDISVPAFTSNVFRYNRAVDLMNKEEYAKAEEIFLALAREDYKDSSELRLSCSQKDIQQYRTYKDAVRYMEDSYYAKAEAAFRSLGHYEDSEERADECAAIMEELYGKAIDRINAKNYVAAGETLKKIYGYKDTADLLLMCEGIIADEKYLARYEQAESYLSDGNYAEAINLFIEISSYKDSESRAVESAVEMFNRGTAEEAAEAYRLLSTMPKDFANAESALEELRPGYKLLRVKLVEPGANLVLGKRNDSWIVIAKEEDKILVVSQWPSYAQKTDLEELFSEEEIALILARDSADSSSAERMFLIDQAEIRRYMPNATLDDVSTRYAMWLSTE